MNWKAVLVGLGGSIGVVVLNYLTDPTFLSQLVVAYPKLAVAVPFITFLGGWLMQQPWFAKKSPS